MRYLLVLLALALCCCPCLSTEAQTLTGVPRPRLCAPKRNCFLEDSWFSGVKNSESRSLLAKNSRKASQKANNIVDKIEREEFGPDDVPASCNRIFERGTIPGSAFYSRASLRLTPSLCCAICQSLTKCRSMQFSIESKACSLYAQGGSQTCTSCRSVVAAV